MLTLDPLP